MFSKGEAIRFGWEKTKKNFGLLAGALGINILVYFLYMQILQLLVGSHLVLSILVWLSSVIIEAIIALGLIGICLKIVDTKQARITDLIEYPHLVVRYLLASLLCIIIVIGGFILLIVPGVIWAVKYQFYPYIIVDRNAGIGESLSISGKITKGNRWNLFLFGLLLLLINLAGLCALLVGLIATIPLSMIAITHVYRKLSEQNETQIHNTPVILTDGQGI